MLHVNRSSFPQSIFNAVNVLMGIAVLSLPLAFRITGWLLGLGMLVLFALITRYTAMLIRNCLASNPDLMTYADIGYAAFGAIGRRLLTLILVIELVAVSVAVVIVLADSLVAIRPDLAHTSIPHLPKLLAWLLLTPTTWLALRWLAYGSVLGVASTMMLTVVVVIDGLSKPSAPGSLWQWAPIHAMPAQWSQLPLSFGLLMAGFAGHAVFPNLYKDMRQPRKFSSMANIAYLITLATYVTMALAGYLMFGDNTMQEITQNLALIHGYPKTLTMATLYMFLLIPMSKYALGLNPVFSVIELRCFDPVQLTRPRRLLLRTALSTMVCCIAIVFPGFHRVMSLVGSFNAFTVCVIFPILCHWRIFGRHGMARALDTLLLVLSVFCAITGTIWSFL
ncbi:transmembrane amino acid transporter protein-domain-containing protein [Syncephalis pseudoplumigaleata]|uniref:Transmembrane amino acid transporter protein-domain-containing protein n=1 Tax=Syncephalis pseudoplumigaleata TaxID=1712513 RepID=A0A4P9Z6B5_9FUNG|nr:transmembrane amino acid transporter protein-domain-containing protein [Syncephalis pseudoplumigaleata]|eukprot:RKP28136.1 transmembrane amino acid transporter protein-domain-containing protein [Syncephalis pseudoplumigaleata]